RLNGDPHVSDIRWYQHVDVKRVVTGGTGGWRDVHEKSPKLISTPPGPIRNPQSGPMRCMPPDKSRASGNPGASKPRPEKTSPPVEPNPLVGVLRTSTCATPCEDIVVLPTSVKAVSDDTTK